MSSKIAFIAHLSELSGSGTSLVETAKAMRGKFETVLILPGNGDLVLRAEDAGISPVIIPNIEIAIQDTGFYRKLSLIKARAGYVQTLRRYFREQKIDLVCVNTSASIFAGLAAKLEGIPIVWRIHESLVIKDRRLRAKTAVIRSWSSAIVYDSQAGKQNLPHPDGKPGLVARNYISIERLAKLGQDRLEAPIVPVEPFRIFMNGTIARKGADVLLESLRNLLKQTPQLSLRITIAGAPPVEPVFSEKLSRLITSPELNGKVEFSGLQQSLVPLLAEADLFVSPSRNEALPIAMVEAIAAGVPVIATDVGDCADLLEDGQCGWVVPPGDIDALTQALQEAVTNPKLSRQKATAAYEKVLSIYGSDKFWKPMEDFLSAVIPK